MLKVFTEAGFDDDADLKACNQEPATKWVSRVLANVSPWELDQLRRESPTKK